MRKEEATVVIPKINDHGIRLAPEALAEFANQVEGDRAIRVIPEHDSHYLPLGKIARVSVEDRSQSVVFKTSIDDTHSIHHFQHPQTGARMIEMTFTNDVRPFVRQSFGDEPQTIGARVDRANFQDWEKYEEFRTEAQDPVSGADRTGLMVRRSLTPDPLIQFFIDYPELAIVFAWVLRRGEKFLRYTVDETLRRVGDDIADAVSERIRKAIYVFDRKRADDDRDATSHVVIRLNPEINLLTRSKDTEVDTDIGLASLCEQMETHKDILASAESATFARSTKEEDWRLRYIETSSGNVIATAECYEETSRVYNVLRGAIPIRLCLKHKTTGAERHYKTSAKFTRIGESGRFETSITPIPSDLGEWELVAVVLEK